jgi:hypothetical protein
MRSSSTAISNACASRPTWPAGSKRPRARSAATRRIARAESRCSSAGTGGACRFRLESTKRVAKTLKSRWHGVLNAFDSKPANRLRRDGQLAHPDRQGQSARLRHHQASDPRCSNRRWEAYPPASSYKLHPWCNGLRGNQDPLPTQNVTEPKPVRQWCCWLAVYLKRRLDLVARSHQRMTCGLLIHARRSVP